MTAQPSRPISHDERQREPSRTSLFDEIASLLERQRRLLLEGDADGLSTLSEELARRLALAAERYSGAVPTADRTQLLALSKQSRINLEMLRRREISVQESLDALTVENGRLGNQRSARVYAPAGILSRSSTLGRSFASA